MKLYGIIVVLTAAASNVVLSTDAFAPRSPVAFARGGTSRLVHVHNSIVIGSVVVGEDVLFS